MDSCHGSLSMFHFEEKGTLDACKDCSGTKCCGNISHGGIIEPPFLTPFDTVQIEKNTGLKADEFSDVIFNPHTGNKVRFVKTHPTQGCLYHDSGLCKIHDFRPVDCRLFPMDMRKLDGELKWIIYNYQHCFLTKKDYELLSAQIDLALKALSIHVIDYATVPVPGMANLKYQVVSQVST